MTDQRNTGESKEGREEPGWATTAAVAAAIAAEYSDRGDPVDEINVRYLTDSLFAISILDRGSAEPEVFFLVVGPDE